MTAAENLIWQDELRQELGADGFEKTPDAVIIADADGYTRLANQNATLMFGYLNEEFLGQPVEMLLPSHLVPKHRNLRKSYQRHPRPRPMGKGEVLYGRHKDGTEIPLRISLQPSISKKGVMIIAWIRREEE